MLARDRGRLADRRQVDRLGPRQQQPDVPNPGRDLLRVERQAQRSPARRGASVEDRRQAGSVGRPAASVGSDMRPGGGDRRIGPDTAAGAARAGRFTRARHAPRHRANRSHPRLVRTPGIDGFPRLVRQVGRVSSDPSRATLPGHPCPGADAGRYRAALRRVNDAYPRSGGPAQFVDNPTPARGEVAGGSHRVGPRPGRGQAERPGRSAGSGGSVSEPSIDRSRTVRVAPPSGRAAPSSDLPAPPGRDRGVVADRATGRLGRSGRRLPPAAQELEAPQHALVLEAGLLGLQGPVEDRRRSLRVRRRWGPAGPARMTSPRAGRTRRRGRRPWRVPARGRSAGPGPCR